LILNLFGEKQTAVETEAGQEKVLAAGSLQNPTEPVCTAESLLLEQQSAARRCGEEERKKENVSTCPCFRIRKVSVKQT